MIVGEYFLSKGHLKHTVLLLRDAQMLPPLLFDLEQEIAIMHLLSYFQKRAIPTDSASETLKSPVFLLLLQ